MSSGNSPFRCEDEWIMAGGIVGTNRSVVSLDDERNRSLSSSDGSRKYRESVPSGDKEMRGDPGARINGEEISMTRNNWSASCRGGDLSSSPRPLQLRNSLISEELGSSESLERTGVEQERRRIISCSSETSSCIYRSSGRPKTTPSQNNPSRSGEMRVVDVEDHLQNMSGDEPSASGAPTSRGDKQEEEGRTTIAKELTCPICLEYYSLPVTMQCGHTFCRYCISHNKLTKGACPLCRGPLGDAMNVNTVLQNLIHSLGLQRSAALSPKAIPQVVPDAATQIEMDEYWWADVYIKPYVCVTLFLRQLLESVSAPSSNVFFDDVVTCFIDHFNRHQKWSHQKWVCSLNDCSTFCALTNFDINDKEASCNRLQSWVSEYIAARPNIFLRKELPRMIIKVHQDRIHRIDAQVFDSGQIGHHLPWDVGRHQASLLHLPHSSVSLSHLLFTEYSGAEESGETTEGGERAAQLGIVDCGATIGTMLKLNGDYELKDGDIIHMGDRLELKIELVRSFGSPYKGIMWNRRTKTTVEWRSTATTTEEGDDIIMVEKDASLSGEGSTKERPSSEIIDLCDDEEEEERHRSSSFVNKTRINSSTNILEALESSYRPTPETQPLHIMPNEPDGVDARDLDVIDTHLQIHIVGQAAQDKIEWADPRGVVLGRGPYAATSYKKISVTINNGYVSREHCLIYYDGDRGPAGQWILRDMSTYGTFYRLKPHGGPYPLPIGSIFKVGQCKIEVVSGSRFDNTGVDAHHRRNVLASHNMPPPYPSSNQHTPSTSVIGARGVHPLSHPHPILGSVYSYTDRTPHLHYTSPSSGGRGALLRGPSVHFLSGPSPHLAAATAAGSRAPPPGSTAASAILVSDANVPMDQEREEGPSRGGEEGPPEGLRPPPERSYPRNLGTFSLPLSSEEQILYSRPQEMVSNVRAWTRESPYLSAAEDRQASGASGGNFRTSPLFQPAILSPRSWRTHEFPSSDLM